MHFVDVYFYLVALVAFAQGVPIFFQLYSVEDMGIARSAGKQIEECGRKSCFNGLIISDLS